MLIYRMRMPIILLSPINSLPVILNHLLREKVSSTIIRFARFTCTFCFRALMG